MISRIALSVIVLAAAYLAQAYLNVQTPLITGQLAGQQFGNSSPAFVDTQLWSRILASAAILIPIVVLAFLAAIWWKPSKRLLARLTGVATAVLLLMSMDQKAYAYYDQTNYTEAYFILPNESAFFIPDVGANKDTQAGFGSEAYLQENKIPAKRFEIPHQKLTGTSYWTNYYVPTGRLIIVDRTPYNREWTAATHRGTSHKDEAMPCQSKEGLNVTAEVGIAVSVHEEDAAKFLYWFGVKPPAGNRTDPQVIFTSVYYGRNLAEVMDGVGRGQVQTLVCNEIGKYPLDKVNEMYVSIIEEVKKNAEEFLKTRGITLDYIGWAGTLTFDKDVQKAINDSYSAQKVAPVLDVLKTKALLDAVEKWNGQIPALPSVVVVPNNLADIITGLSKAPEGEKK